MARENTWLNNDGIEVGFGTEDSVQPYGTRIETFGRISQITIDIDPESEAYYTGAASGKHMQIPAYATIHSANFKCTDGFDAAVEFGTRLEDGTVVAADGLILLSTPINGTNTVGTGTQIGTVGDAVNDLYISMTGTIGTGRGILTVEYIDQSRTNEIAGSEG